MKKLLFLLLFLPSLLFAQAIQTINIGTTPNDGTGDPLRTAFTKTNSNFVKVRNAIDNIIATTPKTYNVDQQFGLLMDGHNITGELIAILNSVPPRSKLIFPPGFAVIDPFVQTNPVSIDFGGSELQCGGKSGTHWTIQLITESITQPNYVTIEHFTLRANSVNPPAIGQAGILVNNCSNINITNFNITGFTFGAGITFTNTQGAANSRTGINVSNGQIRFCNPGINHGTRGEYVNVTNCSINHGGNGTGVIIGAGNVGYDNDIISGFTLGVQVIAGTNDAHGTMSNCQVNHNFEAVNVTGIFNGFWFRGCNFYGGQINIVNSIGVGFSDCTYQLQGSAFKVTNSPGTRVFNSNIMDTNSFFIDTSGSSTILKENYGMDNLLYPGWNTSFPSTNGNGSFGSFYNN